MIVDHFYMTAPPTYFNYPLHYKFFLSTDFHGIYSSHIFCSLQSILVSLFFLSIEPSEIKLWIKHLTFIDVLTITSVMWLKQITGTFLVKMCQNDELFVKDGIYLVQFEQTTWNTELT